MKRKRNFCPRSSSVIKEKSSVKVYFNFTIKIKNLHISDAVNFLFNSSTYLNMIFLHILQCDVFCFCDVSPFFFDWGDITPISFGRDGIPPIFWAPAALCSLWWRNISVTPRPFNLLVRFSHSVFRQLDTPIYVRKIVLT